MTNKYALSLIACILLLFAMGALMVLNTTAAEVLDRSLERSMQHAFFKQIVYATIAISCATLIYFLGYENVLRLSGVFLLFGTGMLFLVFVPGIGQQINGANRWINLFGNSLQPSEFVKYLLPIYTIHVIRRYKRPSANSFHQKLEQSSSLGKSSSTHASLSNLAPVSRNSPKEKIFAPSGKSNCQTLSKGGMNLMAFVRLCLTLIIPIGLILIEPDNGTVAIIMATLLVLFILMRIKWIYWAIPLSACIVCGAIVASQMPHVSDRIRVYLHPELDLQGKGHQPHQARIASGSGGLLGKGFGESLQKLDYLPEARSDYIAAIFAEEFGFIGIVSLIMLYMTIGGLGLTIAIRSQTLEGFYLVAILTFLICFQAFLNLGVVSGLLPSKGTNLPFFSHGGSSLLANFIAMGLIVSAARHQKRFA